VLYLGNPSTRFVRDRMAERDDLGAMMTPKQGNKLPDDTVFACDTGLFGGEWTGYGKWISFLEKLAPHADRCLFATAPDVFRPDLGRGDADGTLALSLPWLPVIRSLGFPTAFVAQEDSEQPGMIPWELVDVVFIGGGDAWKLGRPSQLVIEAALARGKRVHFGRKVNGLSSMWKAHNRGCHTSDSTFISFGPDKNVLEVIRWLDIINNHGEMFAAAGPLAGTPNRGGDR
jgi:hypothetical protein